MAQRAVRPKPKAVPLLPIPAQPVAQADAPPARRLASTLGVMNSPHLFKQWGIVEANLKDARRYLADSSSSLTELDAVSLQQFDEYLSHNELGLAMEEIATLGENYPCKAAFWLRLEQAALAMELAEPAAVFREKFAAVLRG